MSLDTGHVFVGSKVYAEQRDYSLADLITITYLSVSKIRELMSTGEFPFSYRRLVPNKKTKIKSGERWNKDEVHQWINGKWEKTA